MTIKEYKIICSDIDLIMDDIGNNMDFPLEYAKIVIDELNALKDKTHKLAKKGL